MSTEGSVQRIERLAHERGRYHHEAYVFTLESLNHTLEKRRAGGLSGHITGQELLEGVREFATKIFGFLAPTVFEQWGIRSTSDFGEIVFDLVSVGLLAKQESDKKEDFRNAYDFREAFEKEFIV